MGKLGTALHSSQRSDHGSVPYCPAARQRTIRLSESMPDLGTGKACTVADWSDSLQCRSRKPCRDLARTAQCSTEDRVRVIQNPVTIRLLPRLHRHSQRRRIRQWQWFGLCVTIRNRATFINWRCIRRGGQWSRHHSQGADCCKCPSACRRCILAITHF